MASFQITHNDPLSRPRRMSSSPTPKSQAGPSRHCHKAERNLPTTTPIPADEAKAISNVLTSRRRDHSLLHREGKKIGRGSRFEAYRQARRSRGGEEVEDEGEGHGVGEIWGEGTERGAGEEGTGMAEEGLELGREESERLRREAMEDLERFRREMPGKIALLKEKEGFDVDDEDILLMGEAEGLKQDFVWDVLFENQRGLYLFGKAYFSGKTLLQFDPSHYTVPSHPLPTASKFAISQPDSTTSQPHTRLKHIHHKSRTTANAHPAQFGDALNAERPIKTLYTPGTFQLPTPAWEWLTPWMINMRNGTDEGGWRYNYWFRGKKWKDHAGVMGWGGWVRRREMVRLRGTKVEVQEERGRYEVGHEDKGQTWHGKGLKGMIHGEEVNQDVERVMRSLGRVQLDRRKLETWEKWLGEDDDEGHEKLQRVLDDKTAVDTLTKSFTYQSSIPALLSLFEAHNLHTPAHSPISSPYASPNPNHISPLSPTSPSPPVPNPPNTSSTPPKPYIDD